MCPMGFVCYWFIHDLDVVYIFQLLSYASWSHLCTSEVGAEKYRVLCSEIQAFPRGVAIWRPCAQTGGIEAEAPLGWPLWSEKATTSLS